MPLELKAGASAASEAEPVACQQQHEDLARSWLPALVASIVSLYSLGDLVYGFL